MNFFQLHPIIIRIVENTFALAGPEMLLRKTSDLGSTMRSSSYLEVDEGDAIEAHDWRCVRTVSGMQFNYTVFTFIGFPCHICWKACLVVFLC